VYASAGAWGVMGEALQALFHYAQAVVGVRLLRADIDAPNLRSIRADLPCAPVPRSVIAEHFFE
jgi:hypothetical protein